jgi:hypothetical protein
MIAHYNKRGSDLVVCDPENIKWDTKVFETPLLVDYTTQHEHQELQRASNTKQNVGLHYIRHDAKSVADIVWKLL